MDMTYTCHFCGLVMNRKQGQVKLEKAGYTYYAVCCKKCLKKLKQEIDCDVKTERKTSMLAKLLKVKKEKVAGVVGKEE